MKFNFRTNKKLADAVGRMMTEREKRFTDTDILEPVVITETPEAKLIVHRSLFVLTEFHFRNLARRLVLDCLRPVHTAYLNAFRPAVLDAP